MAFAQQVRTRGPEADLALQGKKAAVGRVLVDETLECLDFTPHPRQPTGALDRIPGHTIGLTGRDLTVTPHMCLMISRANPEHDTSVAPSIRRWKS